jgi:beta-glucosidase
LSYTTFTYGKPVVSANVISADSPITLSVSVTNSGSRSGKETVQLYIGDEKASVLRPAKELKAFKKVDLNPGETKTVTFTITVDDLKFYNDKTSEWTAEPGRFNAYIAASSTDIKSTTPFTLK